MRNAIAKRGDYMVISNSSNTYMVVDLHNDCYGYFETERKAVNAMNKIAKLAGQ